MKKIKLLNGKCVLVDDEDYERVSKSRWFYTPDGYAIRNTRGKAIPRLMHRMILPAPRNKDVDHINGNGLDNRKQNLRVCSRAENLHNSKRHKDNKSGYKGVYKAQGRYRAMIMCRGIRRHLGCFDTAKEAALAYDREAVKLHKKFARTNF